jgi:hypothetical protein
VAISTATVGSVPLRIGARRRARSGDTFQVVTTKSTSATNPCSSRRRKGTPIHNAAPVGMVQPIRQVR